MLHHDHHENPHAFTGNGYGGPIEMNMSLSSNGTIKTLHLIKHHETSSYITNLNDFLKQFIGRPSENPLILGKDIDAITGATITSKAITNAVREQRALILKTSISKEPSQLSLHNIIIPVFLTLGATLAFTLRHNPLRWAVLVGSMIYFGIINHTMLSILQVTQISLGLAPSLTQNTLWWMLIGIALLTALLIGRIYCGYLCPFAAVQEILFLLKIRRNASFSLVSPLIEHNSHYVKYALLLLIMMLSILFNSNNIANMEPFITLYTGHGSKLAWLFLALMLILGVFHFRFFCRYLCPVGAMTSLASALSIFKIKATKDCTRCGHCREHCPTQAITPDTQNIPRIDPTECINCAKCLRACPNKSLHITRMGP